METYSGNVLAFVGDAVLSLQVRAYLVTLGYTKLKQLQAKSIKFVSANAQADFILTLIARGELSEDESVIYKRGRNAKSASIAKNADVTTYRTATGMESLWGHLYLTDQQERLEILWNMYKEHVEL